MMIRIGINGFGRIGRMVQRAALEAPGVEIVGINDLVGVEELAHMLAHDSVYGPYPGEVVAADGAIVVDGCRIPVAAERDPAAIPWGDWGAQTVVESTGAFCSRDGAARHLAGGAARVVVSAPGEGLDATFVMGVNHHLYDPARHRVVSNASCTTNCLAPVAKVLHEAYGLERALMTTIHAYTADQRLVDGPHKDPRRARAAALNLIPTSTGAAKAIGLVLPELAGLVDGMSVRVPTPTVSLVDLVALVSRPPAGAKEVNEAFRQAA
ncbi:aldehyde dehydrogenase, partial [bacterium]|nr:aldehyde dehydrogenase [bacterium]